MTENVFFSFLILKSNYQVMVNNFGKVQLDKIPFIYVCMNKESHATAAWTLFSENACVDNER